MKDQIKAKKKSVGKKSVKSSVEFELNPYYEQLLEMRENKPAAFKMMSAATRLSVDAYVRAKEAAAGEVTAVRAAA